MHIRNFMGSKRFVKFEKINDVEKLCRLPPFELEVFPNHIPTCTEFLTAATTAPAEMSFALPSAATVTRAPPVLPTASLSFIASTLLPPPPEITSAPIMSISSATTVLTTETVVPENSVQPIIPPVVSSPSRSITSVPISLSTVEYSAAAATSTRLQVAGSSSIQASLLTESMTPSSSFISTTVIASVTPTTTSALLLIQPSQSTTPAKSSPNNLVNTPALHLSTNAKVAITIAIVLAVLAIIVGALYVITRRKRVARARRRANFTMLNADRTVGDGDETRLVMTGARGGVAQRELRPNGYPQDIKMEGGSLLSEARFTSVGYGERSARVEMVKTREPGLSNASTTNKKRIDLIALPTPPTIAVARAISESGSSQASDGREERINALSMARTLSGGASSLPYPNTAALVETRSKIPPVGIKMPFAAAGDSTSIVTAKEVKTFDHKTYEIQLSKESQELSSLTQEYEAERREREKEKAIEHKKCMMRDRKVQLQSPLLPVLDSK